MHRHVSHELSGINHKKSRSAHCLSKSADERKIVDRRFELFEALFKGATLPLALLPMPLAGALGEHLALLVGRLWRGRMKFAVDNVKQAMANRAVPTGQDPKKVVERHFKNLGRSFVEMIKIYHGRGEAILAGVRAEGGRKTFIWPGPKKKA